MSESEQVERLRDELKQALSQIKVPAGSVVETVRAAHRRRRRRRLLTGSAASVLALGGLVAAQRWSDQDGNSFATASDPAATQPDAALAPPTTVGDLMTSRPGSTAAPTTTEVEAEPPPATLVDSAYTWIEVTPAADRRAGAGWAGSVPGVVVGSAVRPGTDGELIWTVFHTDDAASFERLDPQPPSGQPRAWYGDGDTVYAVGAERDGRLVVDTSDDRGSTWTTVALPVDTEALAGLEHVVPRLDAGALRTDAGLLVQVQLAADIDTRDLGLPAEASSRRIDQQGITTYIGGCGVAIDGDGADTTEPCDPTLYTWDALGVASEAVEAAFSPQWWLFDVSDGTAVEVAPPVGTTVVTGLDDGLVRAFADAAGGGELYRYRGSSGWEPVVVPSELAGADVLPYWTADRLFAVTYAGDLGEPVLVSGPTAAADGLTARSLAGLFPDERLQPLDIDVSSDALAVAAQVRIDALADGPIEVTSGDVAVQRRAGMLDWTIVDAAGGDQIAGATVALGEEGGGFSVVGADGSLLATFDRSAYEALLDTEPIRTWVVLTSADGVQVAADDVAELLGTEGSGITAVDLHAVGEQLVANVTLADGTTRTLAGTPIS